MAYSDFLSIVFSCLGLGVLSLVSFVFWDEGKGKAWAVVASCGLSGFLVLAWIVLDTPPLWYIHS